MTVKGLFSAAPGVVWAAIIVGLMLLADWLSTYFGGVAWVAPLAGFIGAVLVPVLKVLAQGDAPAGQRNVLAETPANPSLLKRLLW